MCNLQNMAIRTYQITVQFLVYPFKIPKKAVYQSYAPYKKSCGILFNEQFVVHRKDLYLYRTLKNITGIQ
jgi:hypothetical protein